MIKILFILLLTTMITVQGIVPVKKNKGLKKTTADAPDDPLISRARAYLDKGKLKIAVHNFGRFCGVSVPAGLWGNFTYIPDIDLIVGIPGKDKNGNPYPWAVGKKEMYLVKEGIFRTFGSDTTYWGPTVSESWMDRTYPNFNRGDWESREKSQIYLHHPLATAGKYYGEQGLYTYPEDQYPLIATSDIPDTWPLQTDAQGNEVNVWPGPYAIDPADTTGQTQLEGVFVSDQDIYFEFDDRFATRDIDTTQGYAIGIRAKVSGYSYSASISEDIIFFRMYLYNISDEIYPGTGGYTYEGVYAGFYFDGDAYNTDILGYRYDDSNLNDMMGYNANLDYGYIYDKFNGAKHVVAMSIYDEDLAYAAVKLLETPYATDPLDLDGDGIDDILPGDPLGLTGWHWFDWYFRPGAADQPPNGYSGDGKTPYRPNKEEIQYKILAGDTTNLDAYDRTHYFHPVKYDVGGEIVDGPLNPRFDSIEGLELEFPDGLDCVFIMSSGPFTIAPGDSVPFSFAVIMGADTADLRVNAEIAQLMYDNNYQGARAPKAPKVYAKEEDEKVTLYWDVASVNDVDIITGYKDFEGFRVYKSTDNGKTWGEAMYNEETRTIYWKPIAQFDLINDIQGFDRIAPHRFLGDNSGLVFKFEDTDVTNGTEYLYAVCAYDRGFIPGDPLTDPDNVGESKNLTFEIPSMENLLANSTVLDHIIKAIPHRSAGNTTLKDLEVRKTEGTVGTGKFEVEVISPPDISGHEYEVLFDCDYSDPEETIIVPGSQRFSVIDKALGDTLIKDSKDYAVLDKSQPENIPIFDGLRLYIEMTDDIVILDEDLKWTPESKCDYRFIKPILRKKTRSDYKIHFVEEDEEIAYKYNSRTHVFEERFKIPFEIINTVTGVKGKVVANSGDRFESGQDFSLYDFNIPEDAWGDTVLTLTRFSFEWTSENIDWQPGDEFLIPIRKPFERGDAFLINTENVFQEEEVNENNISKVKVVPNPYIVHAQWETDDFVRKIQFTNLPAKCKVHIFTVAGEKVITLEHNSTYDGSLDWDLLSINRQDVAPGLYVFVVEADNGQTYTGKFVIIK